MTNPEATRLTVEAIVVCQTPDVCKTPMGSSLVPVAYQIMSQFDNALKTATTVNFTGQPAFHAESFLSTVTGNEAGVGGGIVSGVNLGICRPSRWSATVRTEGHWVVRHDELFMMNCSGPKGSSNTLGKVVYIKIIQMARVNPDGTIEVRKQVIQETELPLFATGESTLLFPGESIQLGPLEGESAFGPVQATNPPVVPETPEEKAWLGSLWESASPWVHGTLDVVGLIPGLGEIADGSNAIIYAAEGNSVDAGLSAGAMIPFLGWGATGGKIVKKVIPYGDKIVGGIKAGAKWVKNSSQKVVHGARQLKDKASKWASDAAQGIKKKWDDFWGKKQPGGDAPEPEKPKKSGGDDGTKVTKKSAEEFVNELLDDPKSIWGKSPEEIQKAFQEAGYEAVIEPSTKGSRRSVQIRIKGHRAVSNIQVHPGGGRHGGAYYKISTNIKGKIKVVDRTTYKPTAGEKVDIIYKD